MRLKFLVFVWTVATLTALWGCGGGGSGSSHPVTRAFYQWSSRGRLDTGADSLLKQLNVKTVYLRFFDVDVDGPGGQPHPIDWYYGYDNPLPLSDSIALVPTVFITNQTFSELEDTAVADLANRVYKKINHMLHQMADAQWQPDYNEYDRYVEGPPAANDFRMRDLFRRDSMRTAIDKRIHEVQFDCDWTPSTKNKYFLFLTKMKEKFKGKIVSSTIRLYGYKYPEKAGVPPVDKGMLMCYNAGDVRELEGGNSIFDKKEILSYLDTDKPYPLPLDYALPIFEWAAVYRDGKLINLLPTDEFDFTCYDYSCRYKPDGNAQADLPVYKVVEEHNLGYAPNSPLLKVGDLIKIERPDLNDVASVARTLGKSNTNPKPVLSLFHFDATNVKKHEKQIEKIYNAF